jgi:chemotaxis protein CheX
MSALHPNLTAKAGPESWVPLLEVAAREVFELMLGSTLAAAPEQPTEEGLDITAMVGLAGQLCGVIALRCTAKSAALMAARMLGVDDADAKPEMWDAVGEVCNMIAGNLKNKIVGMADSCILSVPTVITGTDYSLHALTDSNLAGTPLLFEGLPLIVSIEVHS